MKAPFSWWWAGLALALTIAAVATGKDYTLALAFAGLAVGVAAVAVLESLLHQPSRSPEFRYPVPDPENRARAWLDAGRLGREDLVLLIDRLERKNARPDLPMRTAPEFASLQALSTADFRRYVAARLDAIEAES